MTDSKRTRLPLALLALSLAAGCLAPGVDRSAGDRPVGDSIQGDSDRTTITTIGIFDDYNEILRGTTSTDRHLMMHFFDFEGLVSGIRCVGHGRLTHMPADADPPVNCEDVRGVSVVTCTDGRVLEIEYRIEPDCSIGFGAGIDQFGNTLSFVYGLPEADAEEAVRSEIARASRREPLEVYRPGEVRAEQGFSTGTAFAIDASGHFVTSHHVVAGTDRIWLVDREGNEHALVYVRGDAENDVALLRAESFSAKALPVRPTTSLRKGDRVIALGYPLVSLQGQEQKATFGRVNAMSGAMGDERFLQVDTPIQPGNSGGPLLDRHGNVVGIVTATLNQLETFRETGVVPQNVNYALRTELLFDLLDEGGGYDPPPTARVRDDTPSSATVVDRAEDSVFIVIARVAKE